MISDDGEQPISIAGGLVGPDPVGELQGLEICRLQPGNVAQCAVAGDHVGRDALVSGHLEPVGAERLEERTLGGIELGLGRAAPARPGAAARPSPGLLEGR